MAVKETVDGRAVRSSTRTTSLDLDDVGDIDDQRGVCRLRDIGTDSGGAPSRSVGRALPAGRRAPIRRSRRPSDSTDRHLAQRGDVVSRVAARFVVG